MRQLPSHKDRRLEVATDCLQQSHRALLEACLNGKRLEVEAWIIASRIERVLVKNLGSNILKPTKKS